MNRTTGVVMAIVFVLSSIALLAGSNKINQVITINGITPSKIDIHSDMVCWQDKNGAWPCMAFEPAKFH